MAVFINKLNEGLDGAVKKTFDDSPRTRRFCRALGGQGGIN